MLQNFLPGQVRDLPIYDQQTEQQITEGTMEVVIFEESEEEVTNDDYDPSKQMVSPANQIMKDSIVKAMPDRSGQLSKRSADYGEEYESEEDEKDGDVVGDLPKRDGAQISQSSSYEEIEIIEEDEESELDDDTFERGDPEFRVTRNLDDVEVRNLRGGSSDLN